MALSPTVKIVDPKNPSDYRIISAEAFDAKTMKKWSAPKAAAPEPPKDAKTA